MKKIFSSPKVKPLEDEFGELYSFNFAACDAWIKGAVERQRSRGERHPGGVSHTSDNFLEFDSKQ